MTKPVILLASLALLGQAASAEPKVNPETISRDGGNGMVVDAIHQKGQKAPAKVETRSGFTWETSTHTIVSKGN